MPDHSITFMPAIASTTGRLHAEFLRLLFWHAHRESEELFKLTGQLAQPNQDAVFSKRAAFFNSLKRKVLIMAFVLLRPVLMYSCVSVQF